MSEDRTNKQIEEMLRLRDKRHRKHIHPVREGMPSGDEFIDALLEQPPEMEPAGEPPAPPELPPDEEPEMEPEIKGEGPDAFVDLKPTSARQEHEKKRIALFNTLTEVLDDGKIERTEAAIRTFIDTHREELGTLIELENEVVDLMVKNSDIYRDTQASGGKEEEPGETQTSARRGQPETVPITPPEGIGASVQKILKGEKIDEVLSEAAKIRGAEDAGFNVFVEIEDEKDIKNLSEALVSAGYEFVWPQNDIARVTVFADNEEEARKQISFVLKKAGIGESHFKIKEQMTIDQGGTAIKVSFEKKDERLIAKGALLQYEGVVSVDDIDDGLVVFTTDPTPEAAEERISKILSGARIGLAAEVPEAPAALPTEAPPTEIAPEAPPMEMPPEEFGMEGYTEVYNKDKVTEDIPEGYVEFFTDRGASPAPDYIVPVAHGTAGSDDSDVGTAPMNTDNLGAPEDAVPDEELGVPAPVYKMDIPVDPDQETKLGDVLNKAKEVGILKSWVKITPEELPPEEGPPEEIPPEESVKEQDDIPPEGIPAETVPPEEMPPEEVPPEEVQYIAVEFEDDVEAEERENFPEWIEAETGAEYPAEAVLVDNYEPSTEETLEEPEVPPEEVPEEIPEIPEESGAKK